MQRIATALHVRVAQLLAPVRTLTHVRFRAQKRMTTRENVLANTARWLDDFRELEELLGARIHGRSNASPSRRVDYERIARSRSRPLHARRWASSATGTKSRSATSAVYSTTMASRS